MLISCCHSRVRGNLYKYFYRFRLCGRNDKGFTLIELLIAVSAVSLILVSLAAASTRAVSVQTQARQQAQAVKLAEEQIERVRTFRDRQGFTAINDCAACHLTSPADIAFTSGKLINGVFSIWFAISIPPVNTCPATDNKYIIATAEWGVGSNSHQSTATTCLSKWK